MAFSNENILCRVSHKLLSKLARAVRIPACMYGKKWEETRLSLMTALGYMVYSTGIQCVQIKCRREQTTIKNVTKCLKKSQFGDYIWNHREKCIQISINPDIGLEICETNRFCPGFCMDGETNGHIGCVTPKTYF